MFLFVIAFVVIGIGLLLTSVILVLVAAFRENSREGLLCLFVPGYSLYYLFAKQPRTTKAPAIVFYFIGLALIVAGVIFSLSVFTIEW